MKIVVIDGQGGRLGRLLLDKLVAAGLGESAVCVGANAMATMTMLKSGVRRGATGENAVAVQVRDADVVTGPVGIAVADSLMGEVTPRMAQAVAQCGAELLLIPTNRCRISVVGVKDMTMEQLAEEAVERIRALANA